jgi:membrane-associated phospholipid phosphatase
MTPWVILSPSQFRPLGPPALDSARYTTDFLETKSMGSFSSSIRTADQTLASLFWNASTASYYWDTIAISLGAQRHNTLSENARLLALLNVAMADAAIACWEAKYRYLFWRPVTAIPMAATDGNDDTTADPAWTPLFATPAHPEYPSGHSTVSSAAATVLSDYFGEATSFSVGSDVMVGVVRSFPNFTAALAEIVDARVFAGIHFRSACNDRQVIGAGVGQYVMSNALQPINGTTEGQIRR